MSQTEQQANHAENHKKWVEACKRKKEIKEWNKKYGKDPSKAPTPRPDPAERQFPECPE